MRRSSIVWLPSIKEKAGFTLIELLTTIAITALLSGLFIAYSAGGRDRLTLYREQARLLSIIYRAKSLAIETYAEPDIPCGLGVNFDLTGSHRYRLFRDKSPLCTTANRRYVYDAGVDEVLPGEDYSLPSGFTLVVSGAPNVRNIVFAPPDPDVYISDATGGNTFSEVEIAVRAPNGTTLSVRVNNFGQITSI